MTEPKRLFDCLEYHLERTPLEIMMAGKEGGQWKKHSTASVKETVDRLSAGLLSLGVSCGDMSPEGRDKIAILSKNRPEWVMLDLAVQQIGAVLTPIYPTINVNELEFVLNDAQVKYVFVNDEELFLKVLSLKEKVHSVKEIYTFEHVPNALHWKEVINLATPELLSQIKPVSEKITYEDLATIIYTSGTTGTPKGVMLSHRNILSNVNASMPCFPPGEEMKALSFLPLNHIFERMVTYLYLFRGISIYYAESLETIADNLKEVQPHMFTTVPRLLEKVYDKIMQKGNELTGTKRKLFFWAHGLAEKYEINKDQGAMYGFKLGLANKIIFSKWREGLGGNIKCIVTGGAACQVRLIRIFSAARITIMEGYGLTETSPIITLNVPGKRMLGSVGKPLPEFNVVICDEDGNVLPPGSEGEICCYGPSVMRGYHNKPVETDAVLSLAPDGKSKL